VGKSRLALRLARDFGGEIISADSRQVYRFLDIGTAKPTREEQSLERHHLIDITYPDEDFSLAQYQKLACEAIDDIQQRGRLPLLVGGSGLYVWAVLEGWEIPQVPPDVEFRRSLQREAAEFGGQRLYEELAKVDPEAAQRIDPRNVRRVIRALEVSRHAQVPISELRRKKAPGHDCLIVGLTSERLELYRRIDARVDEMIERGFIDEVKKLVNMGYGSDLPAMSGIGYKQIGTYLRGELTLAAAIEQTKTESHRVVRHQYSWFRLKDERIHWFDVKEDIESEIAALITRFIAGH